MEDRLASLKAMSAFANIDVQVRELVDKWILLTYDLPVTKEGNDARYKFLANAHRIGAIKHTNSVYLMPWTPQAELAALQVAAIGDAFLWISEVKEDRVAKLTQDYDRKSIIMFDKVEERLDKIEGHMIQGHMKRAARMLDKTRPMVDSLINIASQRGNLDLYERAGKLKEKFDLLYKKL